MGLFIQPPFWAEYAYRASAPHAISILVTAPVDEPLLVQAVKDRAHIPHNDEDALIADYIRAARQQVEQETGLALLTQTRDVYLDAHRDAILTLPAQSRPLQSVTSVKTTDTAGAINTLNASNYVVDLGGGRIGLSLAGVWPTDLRPFQPWVIRIVAGWQTPALLQEAEPLLVEAVGLLAAHFATAGRDRFLSRELHDGYEEKIAPYRQIYVA